MEKLKVIHRHHHKLTDEFLKNLTPKNITISLLIVFGLTIWFYSVSYFWPSTRAFSYSQKNCSSKTTLLPKLHSIETSSGVSAKFEKTLTFRDYPLISRATCIDLKQPPKENSTIKLVFKPLGNPLFGQTTTFKTASFPKLSGKSSKLLSGKLSIKDPLQFQLDKADTTFNYALAEAATNSRTVCKKQSQKLKCNVADLKLAQGQSYSLKLVRLFGNKDVSALASGTVQTITPIIINDSSIKSGSAVYDKPSNITLTFDKPIESYEGIKLTKADGTAVGFTAAHSDNQLVITFAEALPRSVNFKLLVKNVVATDEGFLNQPIVVDFATSGGPKVVNKNIGSYGVSGGSAIRLTFDVALNAQTAPRFIQLHGNGGQISSYITVNGNVVTISPSRNFGVCESFRINVLDGIQSVYGITGGSAWQFNSRATCRSTFSIGSSLEGRAIWAHRFGSGPSTVLFVGGTHGNERSSVYTLNSFLDHLESVAHTIPAHRSVVVIPSLNPDGYARGSRVNARGVDLNRNFPANNWKANVTMPGTGTVPNGGGTAPLSEPEAAALASYTQSVWPRVVLTYHSQASIVTYNGAGDSTAIGLIYGGHSGYRVMADSAASFSYDTTGAYENWLHDKLGIPGLLIELPSHGSNYFYRDRNAMWAMVLL